MLFGGGVTVGEAVAEVALRDAVCDTEVVSDVVRDSVALVLEAIVVESAAEVVDRAVVEVEVALVDVVLQKRVSGRVKQVNQYARNSSRAGPAQGCQRNGRGRLSGLN